VSIAAPWRIIMTENSFAFPLYLIEKIGYTFSIDGNRSALRTISNDKSVLSGNGLTQPLVSRVVKFSGKET